MKKETKELIEWIKKQIRISGETCVQNPNEDWAGIRNKAYKFLDSIVEIESHLCRGGYIQDRNGTPCCHGDKVKIHFHNHESLIEKYSDYNVGTLCWDNETKSFVVDLQDGDWVNWRFADEGVDWFEKL